VAAAWLYLAPRVFNDLVFFKAIKLDGTAQALGFALHRVPRM